MNKLLICHHEPLIKRKEYLLNNISSDIELLWFDNWNFDNIQPPIDINYQITKKELSLFLKHIDAMKYVVANNMEYGIIIEDDLLIESWFGTFINIVLLEMINIDYDFIFIGGVEYLKVKNTSLNKVLYHDNNYTTRCAHAYIINNKTCKLFLEYLKTYDLPFDHYLNKFILDNKLRVFWSHPYLEQKTELGIEESSLRYANKELIL